MKKLILTAAFLTVSTASQSVMVRTVLISAQMETNLFCQAGYDGDNMETVTDFLETVRWEKGPEGDQIPHDETYTNFFAQVDHNGYWSGKDLKKDITGRLAVATQWNTYVV